MIFLFLVYCFTNARVETFLQNDKSEHESKNDEKEKMIFQELT